MNTAYTRTTQEGGWGMREAMLIAPSFEDRSEENIQEIKWNKKLDEEKRKSINVKLHPNSILLSPATATIEEREERTHILSSSEHVSMHTAEVVRVMSMLTTSPEASFTATLPPTSHRIRIQAIFITFHFIATLCSTNFLSSLIDEQKKKLLVARVSSVLAFWTRGHSVVFSRKVFSFRARNVRIESHSRKWNACS